MLAGYLLNSLYQVKNTVLKRRNPNISSCYSIKVDHFLFNKACSYFLGSVLIAGAQTFPNASFGWINVKDVANAHIQAFELSSASGRYCLVERVAHYSEVVKILHELYPDLQLPEK